MKHNNKHQTTRLFDTILTMSIFHEHNPEENLTNTEKKEVDSIFSQSLDCLTVQDKK